MSDVRKKRMIPRHVDGRKKLGLIPIRKVPKVFLASIIVLIPTLMFFTPLTLFVGAILIGGIVFIFSEFNGETGTDIIKAIIKYEKRGDLHFERSCLLEDDTERFIIKKIKKIKE